VVDVARILHVSRRTIDRALARDERSVAPRSGAAGQEAVVVGVA
jgi:hypothetical protein